MLKEVWSPQEVFGAIEENFKDYCIQEEKVDLLNALGRILSRNIISKENIPSFDRSTVDGYAVISEDTFGASETMPVRLKIIGEIKMGEEVTLQLNSGEAAYVPTGGKLPQNADAVVMVEYTEDCGDGYIYIEKSSAPGNSIIFCGDDIKENELVLSRGMKLRAPDIGALASLGIGEVHVYRKINFGIISTGDEVVDINEQIVGSTIRDLNTYCIYSSIQSLGAEAKSYGIVKDNYESIYNMTQKALLENDIVVISGGSSVGTKDETFNVINALGKPGVFIHKIAVKPGKPTIIGRIEKKAAVGLPGHPASAYVIFNVFVKKIMEVMSGQIKGDESLECFYAKMTTNYSSNAGREEFVPVYLKNTGKELLAEPINSKSGLISQFIKANGYVRILRECEGVNAGDIVEVRQF